MTHIAKKSMRYGGKSLAPGDAFAPRERDGRLLVAIGKAEIAKPKRRAKIGSTSREEVGEDEGSSGARYSRRDMQAED